ncbi:hypothetical protein BD626DRAFT_78567 [Schizophyllum amplum]|uniref:TPR-like protein n=1 Tax=Schizophyllum amplum TaxID=97359 RepID=A0A550C9J9_9AGAR|nr:hypothetical protein BD626DRAFT_78567 [Auriculariopsis ampla]
MAVIEEEPSQSSAETDIEGLTTPAHADIQARLRAAEELKTDGNDHFRANEWTEALVSYRNALGRLPKRPRSAKEKGKSRAVPDDEKAGSSSPPAKKDDDDEENTPADGKTGNGEEKEEDEDDDEDGDESVPEELRHDCAKARAVLKANIGACYVKMGDHKQAVASCTEALADDPSYVKALQRRASSNEAINTWSSLSSASEGQRSARIILASIDDAHTPDYATLLTLVPKHTPLYGEIERAQRLLKPRVEAAQKEEMAEMMGKLKGLGNSLLGAYCLRTSTILWLNRCTGHFGLSTDNFKFEPNGQGGYSVNFSQ